MRAELREVLFDFFKLKQSALLLWTAIFAFLAGSHLDPDLPRLALTSASVLLTASGTTGFNMILDADIDAAMFRTRHRPLPAGKMCVKEAYALSIAALAAGLALALAVNTWVFLAGLLGFLIDIALYTLLLKRKSPWSTVAGGFAGGMPALGGWAGATGSFGFGGLLLMLLVAVWSNVHIWTLATYYVDDYRRAGVPMLPAAKGERAGVVGSLAASLVTAALTLLLFDTGLLSTLGLAFSLAPLLVAIALLVKALKTGAYRELSYKAFKAVNAYMGLVFLALVIR